MRATDERENRPPEANKVVGYAEGYAVLRLEGSDQLYCTPMEKKYVSIGEHLPDAESKPIYLFARNLQSKLRAAVII